MTQTAMLAALLSTLAFGVSAAGIDPASAKRWVKTTNHFRCMNGVGNVGWSDEAAKDAEKYVLTLNSLVHSAAYDLKPPVGPAGENLAMGYRSIESAVGGWYGEINDCVAFPGCEASKGGMVGHFTALVWKGVTEIGCAINPTNLIYICRYRSGDTLGPWTANMVGGGPLSVFEASKTAAECPGSDELYPSLPDPTGMYPAAPAAAAGPMMRGMPPPGGAPSAMQRIFSFIFLGLMAASAFWLFMKCQAAGGNDSEAMMGTLRNVVNNPNMHSIHMPADMQMQMQQQMAQMQESMTKMDMSSGGPGFEAVHADGSEMAMLTNPGKAKKGKH